MSDLRKTLVTQNNENIYGNQGMSHVDPENIYETLSVKKDGNKKNCGFKIIKYCSLLSLMIGFNGISFYVGYLLGKENENSGSF
jgi:hypothetical protein